MLTFHQCFGKYPVYTLFLPGHTDGQILLVRTEGRHRIVPESSTQHPYHLIIVHMIHQQPVTVHYQVKLASEGRPLRYLSGCLRYPVLQFLEVGSLWGGSPVATCRRATTSGSPVTKSFSKIVTGGEKVTDASG